MKRLYQLLNVSLCWLLLSCNGSGEAFFDFDKVDYYRYNGACRSADEEAAERLLVPLLWEEFPAGINDTAFISDLPGVGYIRQDFPADRYDELRALFSENDSARYEEGPCKPKYRDILVFRKNSAITGIAKICFECYHLYTVGARVDTGSFGSPEEYERLRKLLQSP